MQDRASISRRKIPHRRREDGWLIPLRVMPASVDHDQSFVGKKPGGLLGLCRWEHPVISPPNHQRGRRKSAGEAAGPIAVARTRQRHSRLQRPHKGSLRSR